MDRNNFVVGITGGSGSGKTEFRKKLLAEFSENNICFVSQDNYYRERDQQQIDNAGYVNFDLPEAIDSMTLAEHLLELKNNREVRYSEYSFINEKTSAQALILRPAPIIIVEGIFVLHYLEIVNLLDLKLFVDADMNLMLNRRLKRDQDERGYKSDEVKYRFTKHVIPAYEKYILPYRDKADIVIPNFENFDQAFRVVVAFLRDKIGNIKD